MEHFWGEKDRLDGFLGDNLFIKCRNSNWVEWYLKDLYKNERIESKK